MPIIRRLIYVSVFVAMFSFTRVSHAQGQTSGEILVGFIDAATQEQADALIRSYGLTWESQFHQPSVTIWVRIPGQSVDPYAQAEPYIQEFEKDATVMWAQVRGHERGVPGGLYVTVQFEEGVPEDVARSVIQSVSGVEFFDINISTGPKWGVVTVPAGEEDQWVNEFTRLVWNDPATIVRYAERNQIFGPLDQDQPFQPQIVDASILPSFIALPLPLLAFLAGGIVVALFVVLVLIVLFFMRRKKTPAFPDDSASAPHHVPFKKILLMTLLFVSVIGYVVLFRSPLTVSRDRQDNGQTAVVGNVKAFQQFLASQTRRMAGGLLGSKDLCPNDDCSPPQPGPDTERVTVALTGGQITDLVARFKPASVLISNIQIRFENGKGYATGTSFYPFIPGVVSVEATASLGRFRLEKGWLGQIPIPQRQYALINDGANFLIFNFLESIGVYVDEFDIVGDKIVATAQVPRGLIRVEARLPTPGGVATGGQGDTVIVNVDIITGSTGGGEIEVRTPTAPAEPTESRRIPDIPL